MFVLLAIAAALSFSAINNTTAQEAELSGEHGLDKNATKSNEKQIVKDKIKEKMEELYNKDYAQRNLGINHTAESYGIPYNMVFEDNGKLVVGIDAKKAIEFQRQYFKEDVRADLDTEMSLEVKYYILEKQSNIRGGDGMVNADNISTITVVKDNKIITTGHAFEENEIVSAGLVGGIACQEVQIIKDDNDSGDYADASYGIDTDQLLCDNDYVNDSIHYNGKHYAVTYGTASDITKYKPITIAGIKTTSSGHILDTDATIRIGVNVLHDQVIGNYASMEGDSGAPIFSIIDTSSVKLLGQHVGRACEVDLHSGELYGQWCDSDGQGGLKFFSPWDQVATHLGI